MARGEFVFEGVGAIEAGDAEERRQIFGVAERGADVGNAAVDLLPHALDRHLAEMQRMVFAMRADRVAFFVFAAHDGGIGARHFADQEIGHLHAFGGEDVEDLVGIGRQRSVVEGDHDLFVVQAAATSGYCMRPSRL